jgi:hypothetical protein
MPARLFGVLTTASEDMKVMQPADTAPLPTAFRRIGWSNLFAQFSEQIALAAAPLAAVLLLAAGPAETGWLQTAQTLPFLLLSIPAGLMVDRASRRRLMVGTGAYCARCRCWRSRCCSRWAAST